MIKSIELLGCIKCGLCEQACPGDVIRMSAEDLPLIAYQSDCWTCFNCELVCPAKVINVTPYRKVKPMAW